MGHLNRKKIIDIVQWILIIVLVCISCLIYFSKSNIKTEKEIQTETTYVKVYESQRLAALEKENKILYDSIKNLHDVESAVEIKYVYKIKTDTITVEKFIQKEDSVWAVELNNDTIKTNIEIKANDLKWCNVETEINDKFTIITQEDNNKVQTQINHSPNVSIDNVDMWHRKKNWTDNFHHGPSVTAGYDLINKNFGVMIGYSIIYEF